MYNYHYWNWHNKITECTWLKELLLALKKINVFILLCVLYVLDILQTVDQNVDPCDDFFLHACGGWIKNNPIPPNEPLWNQVLVLKTKNDQVLRTLLGDRRIRERYLTVSQISLIGFTSIQQCTKLPLYTFFHAYTQQTFAGTFFVVIPQHHFATQPRKSLGSEPGSGQCSLKAFLKARILDWVIACFPTSLP